MEGHAEELLQLTGQDLIGVPLKVLVNSLNSIADKHLTVQVYQSCELCQRLRQPLHVCNTFTWT